MSPYRAEGLCRCDFRGEEDLEIGDYFGLSGGPSTLRVLTEEKKAEYREERCEVEGPAVAGFEGGGGDMNRGL